jgi:hypothetical protein
VLRIYPRDEIDLNLGIYRRRWLSNSGFPGESDPVEPKRLCESRSGEVDISKELSAGEIAEAVEFRSAAIRRSGELRVTEADFVDGPGIPEIGVVKDLSVKTCERRKDMGLAHSYWAISALYRFTAAGLPTPVT